MATRTKPAAFNVTSEDLDQIEAEQFQQLKRNGKSQAKSTNGEYPLALTVKQNAKPGEYPLELKTKSPSAAELLAGIEVIEERDFDFAKIKRSKHNPRTLFDEELIAEMAPSIETICRLNPLTIREGTNELIDGETRHRAGEVGKAKKLRCKVVRCSDAQAAVIRILTSLQRRDLNAIDKAAGLKALLEEHGLSQRAIEDVVKMKQGTISSMTKLLDLPDSWKARVISGEIGWTSARELCPWIDEPGVLNAVDKEWKTCPADDRNAHALTEMLDDAVIECSRPLTETNYYDRSLKQPRYRKVRLSPTPEEREQLRIRPVTEYRQKVDRAFNVELWNRLQAEDEKIQAKRESAKVDRESSAPKSAAPELTPAEIAEKKKKLREQLQKRLYRYKVAWLQQQLIATVAKASRETLFKYLLFFCTRQNQRTREKSLQDVFGGKGGYVSLKALMYSDPKKVWTDVVEPIQEWMNSDFQSFGSMIDAESIEALAADAGIDIATSWPQTCKGAGTTSGTVLRDYLELLNKDQLSELIKEWNLQAETEGSKRSETIDAMVAIAKGKPLPEALAKVKPVSVF